MYRLLLVLLMFGATVPATAQSQRELTYRGIPWGISVEQAQQHMSELGLVAAASPRPIGFMTMMDFTDPTFLESRVSAVFVENRLGRITQRFEVDSTTARQLFPSMVRSFEQAYGPADSSSEGNESSVLALIKGEWRKWIHRRSEVELTSKDGMFSWIINVDYRGPDILQLPGYAASHAPERNFMPLSDRWRVLFINEIQRIAADHASTRLPSGNYRAWIRWDHAERQTGSKSLGGPFTYDSRTMRVEIDCRGRRFLVSETIFRDHDETVNTEATPHSRWIEVAPETIGEAIVDGFCHQSR
jgi:hypothetical protein